MLQAYDSQPTFLDIRIMAIGTKLYTIFKGKKIGFDEFGNRYFTERSTPHGRRRKRWVMYKGMPEASKVPAHWHGWLHYTTDAVPESGKAPKPYAWVKEHVPNLTGTQGRYLPEGHVSKGGKRASATADYVAWKPSE